MTTGEFETANHAGDDELMLDQLPSRMLQAVASSGTRSVALSALSAVITESVALSAMQFFGRDDQASLCAPISLVDRRRKPQFNQADIDELARCACESGSTQFGITGKLPIPTVAVPIFRQGQPPEVLCAVLQAGEPRSAERVGELLQFAGSHITLWYVLQNSVKAEQEAQISAVLLETLARVESCESLTSAAVTLVNDLSQVLDCQRAAIGICAGAGRSHCKLTALSGHAEFDRRSEVAAAIEVALDEALLLDRVVTCPAEEGDERHGLRGHEKLLEVLGADAVVSSPLKDSTGKPIGAWLFLNPTNQPEGTKPRDFVQAAGDQVGTSLELVRRGQPSVLRRAWWMLDASTSNWLRRVGLALGLVILVSVMVAPAPHRVNCQCEVQPMVRRFVVAPYDGILQSTTIEPGDTVSEGQVLARMDGREIQLELAALQADYGRARKSWQAALSADDVSTAQRANLEMQGLQLKIELMREREKNLDICSPIAGIVVSGDLQRVEGGPLSTGQTLFEIAPLDQMIAEVQIPEEDIAYVQPGMALRIRLETHPYAPFEARVDSIVPRAEAREELLVFLAKAELENRDQMLRPGMKGRATVLGKPRSVAWLLFHKPYESFVMTFGW